MIKEAEELCKASATSLFSAFTAVYVDWVVFFLSRDYSLFWVYLWVALHPSHFEQLGPCRRILIPVRSLPLMRQLINLLLHVQLVHTQRRQCNTVTRGLTAQPKIHTLNFRERKERIRSLELVDQSIHPPVDELVPAESLAASHTTVSK